MKNALTVSISHSRGEYEIDEVKTIVPITKLNKTAMFKLTGMWPVVYKDLLYCEEKEEGIWGIGEEETSVYYIDDTSKIPKLVEYLTTDFDLEEDDVEYTMDTLTGGI